MDVWQLWKTCSVVFRGAVGAFLASAAPAASARRFINAQNVLVQ